MLFTLYALYNIHGYMLCIPCKCICICCVYRVYVYAVYTVCVPCVLNLYLVTTYYYTSTTIYIISLVCSFPRCYWRDSHIYMLCNLPPTSICCCVPHMLCCEIQCVPL